MSTLAICTPWRDHLDLCADYFQAIEAGSPDQLVIVDDGSIEPLAFAATRIERTGFCAATNAGLALVECDRVLFLNNDIRALRDTWLDEIRDKIEPGYVLGPLRFDKHGDVDGVQYPYVDGWCAAMTTEDARRIGGWDNSYDQAGPAYFSDNAFSFEARRHGLTLRNLRPGLFHKGGQTGGIDQALFQRAMVANHDLWQQHVREYVPAPTEKLAEALA